MKIRILGGSGYIGAVLCNLLIYHGHKIKVIDAQWFGKNLINNKNLKIIKKDIRNLNVNDLKGYDAIIHLANIANDPSVLLKPELSWEVNVLSSMKICELAIAAKIKKIIFSSSGSVYGISKEKRVTEKTALKPISVYNKTKMIAERVFLSYSKYLNTTIIRPATVCGYSERQRLDVIVNILTNHAFFNKKIIIHGGEQLRPNIHIDDMSDSYIHVINNSKISDKEIFNVGDENHSVNKLANMVNEACPDAILKKEEVLDQRSYKISSEKIYNKLGFKTKKTIKNAIDDLVEAFTKKKLVNTFGNDEFYNIKIIKKRLNSLLND